MLFNGKLVLGRSVRMPPVIAVELADWSAWYLASVDQNWLVYGLGFHARPALGLLRMSLDFQSDPVLEFDHDRPLIIS